MWPETTSKREKLLMTRCTPCTLCRTHCKLTTVCHIAVRLLRVNSEMLCHPFQGSPCSHILAPLHCTRASSENALSLRSRKLAERYSLNRPKVNLFHGKNRGMF